MSPRFAQRAWLPRERMRDLLFSMNASEWCRGSHGDTYSSYRQALRSRRLGASLTGRSYPPQGGVYVKVGAGVGQEVARGIN